MNLICPTRKLNHQMLTWTVESENHILAMDGRGKYNRDWLTCSQRIAQSTGFLSYGFRLEFGCS